MKKLINIFIIVIILLMIRCNDTVKPKEEELEQYTWMEIFTPGRTDFEGIEHNLDLGTYSFSFKTSYSSLNAFFRTTDSCALNNNWEIIRKTVNCREYKKRSTIYDTSEWFDFVRLTYKAGNNRIIFESVMNKPTNIEY